MNMNEQDVRALVREAIERHLGRPGQGVTGRGARGTSSRVPVTVYPSTPSARSPHHMSSDMFSLAAKSTTACASSSRGCAAITAGSVSRTVTSPMAKPSILVTYKLPSSAIEPLEAVGDVEVYRDGVLSKDELIRRVKGKHALVVAALDKIDKDVIDAGSDLKIVVERRRGLQQPRCALRALEGHRADQHAGCADRGDGEHGDHADPRRHAPHRRGRSRRAARRLERVLARLHDRIGRPRAAARHRRARPHRAGCCREGAALRHEDRVSQSIGALRCRATRACRSISFLRRQM